jgi:hypothetical protein
LREKGHDDGMLRREAIGIKEKPNRIKIRMEE